MGTVWRADDHVIGRSVAITELHLPDGVPPEQRQVFADRMLREARAAGRLNAPGVVTVYDVVSEHGAHFIVMELVPAPTLEDVVRRQGPLPQPVVVSTALQVIDALGAAHAAGIAHRGVKPSNLMLVPDGRVKLTDFGIAQVTDDPRLTSTGSVIGSPGYMSPERLQDNAVAPAGDLWSLGAVLFFAAEGYGPFDRDTTAATMLAVMSGTPQPVRTTGPLAAVITGLLVPDPAHRLTAHQARAMLLTPVALSRPAAAPTRSEEQAAVPAPAHSGALRPMRPVDHVERPGTVGRRRLRRLTIATLVMALVLTTGWLLGRAIDNARTREFTVYSYGGSGDLWFAPELSEVGTCLYGEAGRGASYGPWDDVECVGIHHAQVFATIDVSAENRTVVYRGVSELSGYSHAECRRRWDDPSLIVGDREQLTLVVLVPTQEEWSPDRDLEPRQYAVCVLAGHNGEELTGSSIRMG